MLLRLVCSYFDATSSEQSDKNQFRERQIYKLEKTQSQSSSSSPSLSPSIREFASARKLASLLLLLPIAQFHFVYANRSLTKPFELNSFRIKSLSMRTNHSTSISIALLSQRFPANQALSANIIMIRSIDKFVLWPATCIC